MVLYVPFTIISVALHQCAVVDVDTLLYKKSVGTGLLRGIGKMELHNSLLMHSLNVTKSTFQKQYGCEIANSPLTRDYTCDYSNKTLVRYSLRKLVRMSRALWDSRYTVEW